MATEILKTGKIKDPAWTSVWKRLRRGQKTVLILDFSNRFKKSGQIIKRGVRTRGFAERELTFLKQAALRHGFAKPSEFPGLQIDLPINQGENE